MLNQVKATKVRLHLPGGEIVEAAVDEVASVPPLGSIVEFPDGTKRPTVPVALIIHRNGETTQRKFLGNAMLVEIVEEESLILEPSVEARLRGSTLKV